MRLPLKDLDVLPYYNEKDEVIDHMHIERPEQLLASLFVRPNMKVLELGGRYGTVSCVINNILDNAHCHIVVEPDRRVLKALERNKVSHQSSFKVFHGIITENKEAGIVLSDYETSSVLSTKDSWIPVPRKSFQELKDHFGISFNCLFADCEGGFASFVKNNVQALRQFELIIFEADGPVNYIETHSLLRGMKFKQILNWQDLHYVYINLSGVWPDGLEPLS